MKTDQTERRKKKKERTKKLESKKRLRADGGLRAESTEDFKRKRNGSSKHRHFDRIQLAKVIQVSRR